MARVTPGTLSWADDLNEDLNGIEAEARAAQADADAAAAAAAAAQGTANGAVPKSLADAKGDLLVATAADVLARMAVGADGTMLQPDSSQGNGWKFSTALRLEGAGSPEGVKTAPVGSTYVDSAATNGAVLWVKTSGTGNTGWRVAYGDTGIRTIASWDAAGTMTKGTLPAGWKPRTGQAGNIQVRRVGRYVDVYITNVACAVATTNDRIWTATAGWIPASSGLCTLVSTFLNTNAATLFGLSNFLGRAGGFAIAVDTYLANAQIRYVTEEQWPSSLP